MIVHDKIDDVTVRHMIRAGIVVLAGNSKLKIFGKLSCKSGKRMTRPHRVFFSSFYEATLNSFRPCAHCLKNEYRLWKAMQTNLTNQN